MKATFFACATILVAMFLSRPLLAATYYTTASGNWTSPIWGASSTGAGSALPVLNDGDVLYIDDDITLNSNVSIPADITIVVNATLTIRGQLRVGAGSVFQLPSSSGQIVPDGPGNSEKIFIGDGPAEWTGDNGTLTGPGSFDDGWTCCTMALPVKLSYFNVQAEGEIVSVRWATSMEENFREFVIERSDDGINYEPIGSARGKGFDVRDIESRYAFEDRHPLRGLSYYRLKAVDLDNSFEYFGAKAVSVATPRHLAVHPNPSSGDALSFNLNYRPDESATIVVLDQRGLEVFRAAAGTLRTTLAFKNRLRSGIYLLRYISSDFENTTRFIVKN